MPPSLLLLVLLLLFVLPAVVLGLQAAQVGRQPVAAAAQQRGASRGWAGRRKHTPTGRQRKELERAASPCDHRVDSGASPAPPLLLLLLLLSRLALPRC